MESEKLSGSRSYEDRTDEVAAWLLSINHPSTPEDQTDSGVNPFDPTTPEELAT